MHQSTYTLYGIPNCDSCRKALRALESTGLQPSFHDLRADPVDRNQLRQWIEALGPDRLINKRSTTWRKLKDEAPEELDPEAALALCQAHPTLIKRPVLEHPDGALTLGFDPQVYAGLTA
ncbi:MAG: Spx/MgsR family RNA polymerase-binding regulatory protein [Pseudomonadota bacterium]|nr:Spx/MgsR family RNA polymerase-binding regulatory protein [Pseudomonadota bacterium]